MMRFAVASVLALFSSLCAAQESIYVGLGVGSFDYKEQVVDILYGRVADTSTATKFFGGFEFNEHVAMEISYGETSDLTVSETTNIPPFGDVSGTLKLDFNITSLRAVGQLPFDWGILLGGLGYFTSDNDFREDIQSDCCGTARNAGSIRDDGLTAMLGVEWRWGRFGTRWAARVEYEWWDITDLETSNLGLGLSYGF